MRSWVTRMVTPSERLQLVPVISLIFLFSYAFCPIRQAIFFSFTLFLLLSLSLQTTFITNTLLTALVLKSALMRSQIQTLTFFDPSKLEPYPVVVLGLIAVILILLYNGVTQKNLKAFEVINSLFKKCQNSSK